MSDKQRKTLPRHEPIHEDIYEHLLVRYGYNTRPKVERVHRGWLAYFHVEDTSKNRDALRKRMEHLHPDKAACPAEKREELASRRASRTEFFIADQDDDRMSDRERLDAVLEVTQNSVLNGNCDNFTVQDFLDVMAHKLKLNEQEATLHGLVQTGNAKGTTGKALADKLSGAERIREELKKEEAASGETAE